MTDFAGSAGSGLYRSTTSRRLYLLNNGFVIGEVSPQAERELADRPVHGSLHAAAELDYLRRKLDNLNRYAADLEGLASPGDGAPLRPQSASGFRVADVADFDFRRMAPALRPRLVQLGNTGCYVYAQGGWRHVFRPDAADLAVLQRVPAPQLVADAGLAAFAARERAEVQAEGDQARRLLEALARHPDLDDVNRSYG